MEDNMNQNEEEFTVLTRSEFIRQARDNCSRNLNPYNQHKKIEENNIQELSAPKRLLIRGVFALLVLLTVIVLDKIDVKFNTGNGLYIEKMITSNQSIDEAQDFFISIYEKLAKE